FLQVLGEERELLVAAVRLAEIADLLEQRHGGAAAVQRVGFWPRAWEPMTGETVSAVTLA
ncbi:hypothetical protein, partial [Mesorhizobium sp. M1A.T.Ca.IN.004.03.1.1]|uniref:hypothetical protein n=1 Tax=Mesorhizobium sp. M1A.T.Ca.IN.004.03.1.1 TaxID=2496795 RepID=UPI0019D1D045